MLEDAISVKRYEKDTAKGLKFIETCQIGSTPGHIMKYDKEREYPFVISLSKTNRIRLEPVTGTVYGFHRKTLKEIRDLVDLFARPQTLDEPEVVPYSHFNQKFPRVCSGLNFPFMAKWQEVTRGVELINVDTGATYTLGAKLVQVATDLGMSSDHVRTVAQGKLVKGWRLKN